LEIGIRSESASTARIQVLVNEYEVGATEDEHSSRSIGIPAS
jgi:hypothetical protein